MCLPPIQGVLFLSFTVLAPTNYKEGQQDCWWESGRLLCVRESRGLLFFFFFSSWWHRLCGAKMRLRPLLTPSSALCSSLPLLSGGRRGRETRVFSVYKYYSAVVLFGTRVPLVGKWDISHFSGIYPTFISHFFGNCFRVYSYCPSVQLSAQLRLISNCLGPF